MYANRSEITGAYSPSTSGLVCLMDYQGARLAISNILPQEHEWKINNQICRLWLVLTYFPHHILLL